MFYKISSIIMRTTLDLEKPVLDELKALGKVDGRSLGQVASQLLATALVPKKRVSKHSKFRWKSQSMRARVDLSDKDAVFAILDRK